MEREELERHSHAALVQMNLTQDSRLGALLGNVGKLRRQLEAMEEKLTTAEWQAQLLADQRDAVLRWCAGRGPDGVVTVEALYEILITDPRDRAPDEVN